MDRPGLGVLRVWRQCLVSGLSCGLAAAQPQFVATILPMGASAGSGEDRLNLAAGDVDGDGDVDLVGMEATGIGLFLNSGFGEFVRANGRLPGPGAAGTSTVVLRDFNSDGSLDILTIAAPTGLSHWRNDGRGFFVDVTASTLPWGGNPSSIAIADFDRDGLADIVLTIGAIDFLRNTGLGVFGLAARLSQPPALSFQTADVTGDGRPDVLGVGPHSSNGFGPVYLLRNAGGWSFPFTQVAQTMVGFPRLAVADVDGDGDVDLLILAYATSRIWLNDGRGNFVESPASLPAPVTYSCSVAFADFDEDGDLDLWMGNGDGFLQPDQLYLNDGRGHFTDVTVSRTDHQPRSTLAVISADIDGDGDIDVLAAHSGGPAVAYRNMLRDVSFTGAVRIGNPAPLTISGRRGFASGPQVAAAAISTRPLAPPIAVPPFGVWRLDPVGLIVLPAVPLSVPGGEATVPIPVPLQQALVGQTVLAQALVAHGVAPSSWHFTNVAHATIGR